MKIKPRMPENAEFVRGTSWKRRIGCAMFAATFFFGTFFFIVVPALKRAGPPGHYNSCQNHLKQFGIAYQMYAGENIYRLFPHLSSTPGELFWVNGPPSPIVPDYLGDPAVAVCPDEVQKRIAALSSLRLAFGKRVELERYVTTEEDGRTIIGPSYWYLGYILSNDDEVEAFAEVYKKHIANGGHFAQDLEAPLGRGSLGGDKFLRFRKDFDKVFPELSSKAGKNSMGSPIPVMIERPGNHVSTGGISPGSGCNILYLDGHVEFHRLGTKWPVTERTIKAFESIEALSARKTKP